MEIIVNTYKAIESCPHFHSHKRLRDILGNVKGKFLLSYNHCKEIEQLYEGYDIIKTERFSNLTSAVGGKGYKELLIKNYQNNE